MNNIVKLDKITKVFPGGVVANKDITLEIREGEIHSIAGENGAGKSTLMSILFGLYPQTSGSIEINGEKVKFSSSKEAIAKGLGMVHQHFMLIPKFTVTQNIILGMDLGNKFKIDYKKAEAEIKELSDKYGLNIDPSAKVSDISVPMQQRVEILKVLYRQANVLIFDEPTAVLTPQEIDEFCAIMEKLREQGKTIIFISHKLAEVMRVSDRISVIRLGKVIDTLNKEDTNENDLATLMVGREVVLGGGDRTKIENSKTLLQINNLTYKKDGVSKLHDLSLSVNEGEIIGVAGVDGNGQEELVNIICGKVRKEDGSIQFCGEDISKSSIKEIKSRGLATIFEDRHKDGLVLQNSIKENMIMGYEERPQFTSKGLFINYKALKKNAEELKERFDIRCSTVDAAAGTLSGGNQQKIIIAREVTADPKLIMAVQPTRGLDMGAIQFVHEALVGERNKGKGVLLFSLELDEILQLSDKIAVIFKGEIVKVIENKNVTKEILGALMLGIGEGESEDDNI